MGVLPDWWWVVRDLCKIFRKSRAARWELPAPFSWPVIAIDDIILSDVLTERFAFRLSVLTVWKSTRVRSHKEGEFGDSECVNALHVVRLQIHTFAMKCQMRGRTRNLRPFAPYRYATSKKRHIGADEAGGPEDPEDLENMGNEINEINEIKTK